MSIDYQVGIVDALHGLTVISSGSVYCIVSLDLKRANVDKLIDFTISVFNFF